MNVEIKYVESVYVAHPVGGDPIGNAARARRWLRWLIEREPDVAFCVPWLPYLDVLTEDNPEHRTRGLRDVIACAGRCHGIVLCGGRISEGMGKELREVLDVGHGGEGGWVADLIGLGDEPPSDLAPSYRPLDVRFGRCVHGTLRQMGRDGVFVGKAVQRGY